MIPLVVANEQGSVQAFNPTPQCQELWSSAVIRDRISARSCWNAARHRG